MTITTGRLGVLDHADEGDHWPDEGNALFRAMHRLVMPLVLDKDLATPPVSPADADAYIVAASPTGAWVGHAKAIAAWSDDLAAWEFYAPLEGFSVWVADENLRYTYDGSAWAQETMAPAPVKTETASYALVLADAGKWIRMNVAGANNLTVPTNASVAFPVNTEIHVEQMGAGQTTVVASGGVTIRTPETLKLATQYAVATLKKVGADEWVLTGYLEAAP